MSEKNILGYKTLSVRVPGDLIDGLEVLRSKWIEQNKGMPCSREAMIRAILYKAVEEGDRS